MDLLVKRTEHRRLGSLQWFDVAGIISGRCEPTVLPAGITGLFHGVIMAAASLAKPICEEQGWRCSNTPHFCRGNRIPPHNSGAI
jgi:hypothetical protein